MREDHVCDGLLIRAIDDELNEVEANRVETHLAMCEACARRRQHLWHFSASIESTIAETPVAFAKEERESLERELEAREIAASQPARAVWRQWSASQNSGRTSPLLRRLSWGMAIAAVLAFGLMFVPQWKRMSNTAGGVAAVQPGAYEVDGESFVALPYSNPDLPLNAAQIVQMQVPISALADAGIVFEPISNEIASADRSVRADVVLGMDGRPAGIHVLSEE
jgi:hypothetical protein